MDVPLTKPELEAQVTQWVADTGRPAEELVEAALTSYFDSIAQVRQTLDSRYDDIVNGKVKMIPGGEVLTHFERKAAPARQARGM